MASESAGPRHGVDDDGAPVRKPVRARARRSSSTSTGTTGTRTRAPRGSSKDAQLAEITESVAAVITVMGLGASKYLPTTGHTTVRVAPGMAASTVKLAAKNPAVLKWLAQGSDLKPWFELGTSAAAITVAVGVDMRRIAPDSMVAARLGVFEDFLEANPDAVKVPGEPPAPTPVGSPFAAPAA